MSYYYSRNNMAGGLIQIATYGSQDLFLTGTPEITFFKVVYRRHTSFSMESIVVNFDDPTEFDSTSVAKIPKVGDLMHRTYVEIQLPEIDLQRTPAPSTAEVNDIKAQLTTAQNNYQIVKEFMTVNRNAFVSAYSVYISENNASEAVNDMNVAIKNVFDAAQNTKSSVDPTQDVVSMMSNLIATSVPAPPFIYNEISMQSIANRGIQNKDELFNQLQIGIDKSIKTQKYYYDITVTTTEQLNDAQDQNIKFAWVDRIGHAIMESIEIKIGGHKIDKHYGDWLNIWYELSGNRSMETIYFKMIGNVQELTTFNREIKPSYTLRIPLQFWFCRFSGLSIPLVALEYHNVSIHIKFRKFEELCYIEQKATTTDPDINIKYSKVDDGIKLDEVPGELGLNIQANLLIDYIYLDSPERRRFAQSSHEYLIEQLQFLEKTDVTQQNIQFNINNFVHPSKEIVWVSQKTSYTNNDDGTNRCRWDNYSVSDNNVGNSIIFSSLDFHSYKRVIKLDSSYFNYVQPYETHRATPSDGINMYSFSIFPEEHQPSGSANLSRLSRITLYMDFDPVLFDPTTKTIIDPLILRIYTRNLNILRIVSGFGGLAFTFG